MSQEIQKEIQQGLEAKQLLEHPLLVAAMESVERDAFAVFRTGSDEAAATARATVRGAEALRGKLKAMADRGERRRLEAEKAERDRRLQAEPPRRSRQETR